MCPGIGPAVRRCLKLGKNPRNDGIHQRNKRHPNHMVQIIPSILKNDPKAIYLMKLPSCIVYHLETCPHQYLPLQNHKVNIKVSPTVPHLSIHIVVYLLAKQSDISNLSDSFVVKCSGRKQSFNNFRLIKTASLPNGASQIEPDRSVEDLADTVQKHSRQSGPKHSSLMQWDL